MNTLGVNIIANKTFANVCEQLLTRKSQFIHELLTELSTFAEMHCAKLKRDTDKRKVIAQCDSLTKALISGYRTGVAGTVPLAANEGLEDCEQTVKYLCAPFRTKGYQTACMQIELLLARGHHKSQRSPSPDTDPKRGDGPSPAANQNAS